MNLLEVALDYQELNGVSVDHFDRPPTALEFARMANIARPVTFSKNAFPNLPARDRWTDDYLVEAMGDALISISVTPNGHADAVTRNDADGIDYFVEPYIEKLTMKQLIENIKKRSEPNDEIHYLQSQNGNIHTPKDSPHCANEFERIRNDVPTDVSWASEAFGQPPDAVNVWVGDERSVTSIHSDPYENIYTVLRGSKHFLLLPPTEGFLLAERPFPRAAYTRREEDGKLFLQPQVRQPRPQPLHSSEYGKDQEDEEREGDSDTSLIMDGGGDEVLWASVDPTLSGTFQFNESSASVREFSTYARPIDVELNEGETLYLPSGWWHHVTQRGDSRSHPHARSDEGVERGVCIALNWWYDMEMRGDRWVWLSALRKASRTWNSRGADNPRPDEYHR